MKTTMFPFSFSTLISIKPPSKSRFHPSINAHSNNNRPTTTPPSPLLSNNPNASLFSALANQVAKDTLPWLSDLVLPLFSDDTGSPYPPPPTVDTTLLTDPDSNFVTIDGVRLHYKTANWTPSSSSSSSINTTVHSDTAVLLCHGFNGSTFSWRYTLDAFNNNTFIGNSYSNSSNTSTSIRLIAFDRPPFGLSDRPLSSSSSSSSSSVDNYNPYSLDGNIKLTLGLLKRLGITKVIAVGHSAGAITAMELYNQAHTSSSSEGMDVAVIGLCLVAPALLANNPETSFMRGGGMTLGAQLRFLVTKGLLSNDVTGLRYVRRQILKRRDEVARGDLGAFTQGNTSNSKDSDSSDDEEEETVSTSSSGGGERGNRWSTEAIEGYLKPLKAKDWDKGALLNLRAFQIPSPYEYSSTNVPVLVINGANDGRLTVNGRALADEFFQRDNNSESSSSSSSDEGEGGRRAKTEYLELQCGHLPMEEKAEEFNQALADFILHCCSA